VLLLLLQSTAKPRREVKGICLNASDDVVRHALRHDMKNDSE
jgi:hypothetical protein